MFLLGLAAAQISTTLFHGERAVIKAGGPTDPLEAWSEASYIIWRYNTTHTACRNMSTLLVDISGTDPTPVIQYALDSRGDGSVFLKAGVYEITETLNVTDSNLHLYGEIGSCFYTSSPESTYYGTEIRGDGSFGPLLRVRAPDDSRMERIAIDHLGWNGRATGYTAGHHNLYFYNCSEVWISKCEIYQAGAHGIEMEGTGELNWIMYNDITGNMGSGIETSCLVDISHNHLFANNYTAIKILCQNCDVSNNIIVRNYKDGIWVQDGSNVMIANNRINDNDYNDQGLYDGIVLNGYSNNCTIVGNKCLNNDRYDIHLHSSINHTLVVANNCNSYDQQGYGICDEGDFNEIHSCFNGTDWIT